MKITEQIKQKLETLNKGCGEYLTSRIDRCGEISLCPTCKSSKEAFINGCLIMIESEIGFLELFDERITEDRIPLPQIRLKDRIKELLSLKEYLLGEIGK